MIAIFSGAGVEGAEGRAGVADEAYDRAAFLSRLFDDNYDRLRRLAFALLGDDSAADEVAQESFVLLYASWRRLDDLEHPPSFLRRIVVNLCRSRARRLRVQRRVEPLLRVDDRTNDPDTALRLDVWKALEGLPQRQRACVVLRYLEDLSEADIAQHLDCSIGTVKSQLHKAKVKLESSLRDSIGDMR